MPSSDGSRTASVIAVPSFTSTPFRNRTAPEVGADEGAEAVERLAEGQAEVAALGRAERGRERIGGDLQDGDPAGQHEQPEQHEQDSSAMFAASSMIMQPATISPSAISTVRHGLLARQAARRPEGSSRHRR